MVHTNSDIRGWTPQTFVSVGDLDAQGPDLFQALSIASRISCADDRKHAYTIVGLGFARKGMDAEVYKLAQMHFKNDYEGVEMLRNALDEMVSAGRFFALIKFARQLPEFSLSSWDKEFAATVRILIEKNHLEEAIEIANLIHTNTEYKGSALGEITRGLGCAGRIEEALSFAEKIPHGSISRNYNLAYVSKLFTQRRQYERAFDVAKRISSEDSALVCFLGKRMDELDSEGNPEQSFAIRNIVFAMSRDHQFDKALAVAEELRFRWRTDAFTNIAAHMAEAGRVDEALQIASTKIAGCGRISYDESVKQIACALIPTNTLKAIELVQSHGSTQDSLEWKDCALASIAEKMSFCRFPDQAVAIVNSLVHVEQKEHVARMMVQHGHIEHAVLLAQGMPDRQKISIANDLTVFQHPKKAEELYAAVIDRSLIEKLQGAEAPEHAGPLEEAVVALPEKDEHEKSKEALLTAYGLIRENQISEALAFAKAQQPLARKKVFKAIIASVVQIGQASEIISAIKAGLDPTIDEKALQHFKKRTGFIKLIVTESMREVFAFDSKDPMSLFLEATRLFKEQRFSTEETIILDDDVPCHCETRVDLVMSIAAKLLLERGNLQGTIETAEKIRARADLKSAIYEQIAEKIFRPGGDFLIETIQCTIGPLRDKLLLKIIKNLVPSG